MMEKCDLKRCGNIATGSIEDSKGSFSLCDAHFGEVTSAALYQRLSLADAVDAVEIKMSDGKVYLTPEQRDTLAVTLEALAYALRENWELRTGDLQDVIDDITEFQQSSDGAASQVPNEYSPRASSRVTDLWGLR
jgi:hypothetical protein